MKISIIIPIYVVPEQYLRECLDSIVVQDMQEMECLLVSDGAPEKEESICKEYCAKDSRFRLIQKEHAGVSAARNLGIKEAQGKYITFVDADDWISSNILENAYKAIERDNCDIVLWNCVNIKGSTAIATSLDIPSNTILSKSNLNKLKEELFFINDCNYLLFVYPFCKLYKANLIKDIEFKEHLQIGEDRIFNIQVIHKNPRIVYINNNSYFYRQNEYSATKRFRENAFSVLYAYIYEMEQIADIQHHSSICNELLCKFDESLTLDFFHKDNPYAFSKNISRIKEIFFSTTFQNYIKNCDPSTLSFFHKLSLFFIKRRIILWIYLRAIMRKFSS